MASSGLTHGERERVLGDRGLVVRAGIALVLANVRYWSSVAPLVRRELRSWGQLANAIPDPHLRTLALEKLHAEHFNAEVAATLATLAPARQRESTVKAIVALELLYDFLDGLTERPSRDPLRDGETLFEAFTDAVDPHAPRGRDYYRDQPELDDAGYLEALSATVRIALATLPASEAVAEASMRCASRSARAQAHLHAAATEGSERLTKWASREAASSGLEWREYLSGAASSVLAVHALIAAAADTRTTPQDALQIEQAYLSTCVLITLLDSVVDYEEDRRLGMPGFVRFYEDRDELVEMLADAAASAVAKTAASPNGAHHVMTLVGVAAYYTSAPGAWSDFARPVAAQAQAQLQPLITPTLAIMRAWRLAKRVHRRCRGNGIGVRGRSRDA
jgi:tetraprenyl-beta-curcumene synthase